MRSICEEERNRVKNANRNGENPSAFSGCNRCSVYIPIGVRTINDNCVFKSGENGIEDASLTHTLGGSYEWRDVFILKMHSHHRMCVRNSS